MPLLLPPLLLPLLLPLNDEEEAEEEVKEEVEEEVEEDDSTDEEEVLLSSISLSLSLSDLLLFAWVPFCSFFFPLPLLSFIYLSLSLISAKTRFTSEFRLPRFTLLATPDRRGSRLLSAIEQRAKQRNSTSLTGEYCDRSNPDSVREGIYRSSRR